MKHYFVYHPSPSKSRQHKIKTHRVRLPKLNNENAVTHTDFQKFLNQKATETYQRFRGEGGVITGPSF